MLTVHIVGAGAWIGTDLVMGVLVFTARLGALGWALMRRAPVGAGQLVVQRA
jgi:hypothetical protein